MNEQVTSERGTFNKKIDEILPSCMVCSRPALQFHLSVYGFDNSSEKFNLFRCNNCGIVCVWPILTPGQLQKYYQADYYGGQVLEKKSKQKFNFLIEELVRFANQARCAKLIHYLNSTSGRVLDVGCGRGSFLIAMAKKGFKCVGSDISQFEQNDSREFTFCQGSLESLSFQENSFDAVSIWHVLEHTLNPASTIQEIHKILKPGGVLAIAVPNFGSWQSRFFGRHWFHLDIPRHIFHFDQSTLFQMLFAQGFDVISSSTLSWDQNVYGWIQSFQNAIFYRKHPNKLFSILKRTQTRPSVFQSKWLEILFQILLLGVACLLFIPAFLETVVSALFGKGATLIIYLRKNDLSIR